MGFTDNNPLECYLEDLRDRLHVVAGEHPFDSIQDALVPTIGVLVEHVDDVIFLKSQLVLQLLLVAINGNDWEERPGVIKKNWYDKNCYFFTP